MSRKELTQTIATCITVATLTIIAALIWNTTWLFITGVAIGILFATAYHAKPQN